MKTPMAATRGQPEAMLTINENAALNATSIGGYGQEAVRRAHQTMNTGDTTEEPG